MRTPSFSLVFGLAFVSLLLAVAPASAEISVGTSLEWLTCSSEVVVVGKIVKITTTRGPGAVLYEDGTVEVEETIQGMAGKQLVFCLRSVGPSETLQKAMLSQEGVLLFLSRSKDHGPEHRLENMLVPSNHQFPLAVFDLSTPGKYAFNQKLEVLSKKLDILETCRLAKQELGFFLKQNPGAKLTHRLVNVPFTAPAHQVLYAGSTCYVKVPNFAKPAP